MEMLILLGHLKVGQHILRHQQVIVEVTKITLLNLNLAKITTLLKAFPLLFRIAKAIVKHEMDLRVERIKYKRKTQI